jgi:peptidyl-prolyl cis-trans isomerase-like 3
MEFFPGIVLIWSLPQHDKRGVVAFANKGPDTNAIQFYITFDAAPHLDNVSTIFAQFG